MRKDKLYLSIRKYCLTQITYSSMKEQEQAALEMQRRAELLKWITKYYGENLTYYEADCFASKTINKLEKLTMIK